MLKEGVNKAQVDQDGNESFWPSLERFILKIYPYLSVSAKVLLLTLFLNNSSGFSVLAKDGMAVGSDKGTPCSKLSDSSLLCFPKSNLQGVRTNFAPGEGADYLYLGELPYGVFWDVLVREPSKDPQCATRPRGARFAYTGGARWCPLGVAPTEK